MKTKLIARKSNKYIYASLQELVGGKTLSGVRAKNPEEAGAEIAKKAVKHKVAEVVFDRGNNRYHGQIKKLADAARAGGLKF
mgnify:CR=1 FL=1